jgi:2'-5' RNA ligase/endonuclease/exonuclease/phosphatase family metal-dependent hydrolase
MEVPSKFNLASTATALAIIIPTRLQSEINSLRKVHDKAYRRWQPHINILYPFVEPSRLHEALALLKSSLASEELETIRVDVDDVGVFRHRKNATVFLKPSKASEDSLRKFRSLLTAALGCEESDGTHDGEFKPHLTIGQASLLGGLIEKLVAKAENVKTFGWNVRSLAVMKRESSGEMKIIEEIAIGDQGESDEEEAEDREESHSAFADGWRPSYWYSAQPNPSELTAAATKPEARASRPIDLTITSYNVMFEPRAPPLSRRGPLLIQNIASAVANSQTTIKILCLQEVNGEMLTQLLSDPFIQKNYPFSTHTASSFLPNHRNLVILASESFTSFTLEFDERHKSALIARFEDIGVDIANVHLTSALSDKSVRIKQHQLAALTKFFLSQKKTGHEIILTGDFNLTTSTRTIETALSRDLITPETANTVRSMIDTTIWEDAFLTYWASSGENYDDQFEGEEGATFDRQSNPLAAMFEPPIDKTPQRYDRILIKSSKNVDILKFGRFGFPDDHGRCASDHFGICATMKLAVVSGADVQTAMIPQVSGQPLETIPLITDTTNLLPMISEYLPADSDRNQRQQALDILKQNLTSVKSLEDLVLAPLGSYCMDTYFADSDVDVLAMGSISPKEFFELALVQMRNLTNRNSGGDDGIKALHYVNSLVPIIELVVGDIKIDLQYCQASELLER